MSPPNQFSSSGDDITRLIDAAQATTRALNNLNQTLSSILSALGTAVTNLQSTVSSVVGAIPTFPGLPNGATVLEASAQGSNTSLTATLPAIAAATTWITGFEVTSGGATGAGVVNVTVTGPTNTLNYTFVVPAGATAAATPLTRTFPTPIPASGQNVTISVTVPALGSGNTSAAVCVYGFRK